jgi:hypothetical protein
MHRLNYTRFTTGMKHSSTPIPLSPLVFKSYKHACTYICGGSILLLAQQVLRVWISLKLGFISQMTLAATKNSIRISLRRLLQLSKCFWVWGFWSSLMYTTSGERFPLVQSITFLQNIRNHAPNNAVAHPEDQNSQIHHSKNLKNSFRSFTFARVGYRFKVAATQFFVLTKFWIYMNIQYTELQFCLIFYMGVNTGLLTTQCWGRYLCLKGRK